MAISSSSGSNSIDYPSSPLPSSSSSSTSSLDSIPESREPMPEYDPKVAYEVLTPLHWDAEEFDFRVISEDDEPKTNGEDLRLLFQEEAESDSDNGFSWDGADSSSEEEIGSSSGDDPTVGNAFQFLGSSEEDGEEESDGGSGRSSDDEACSDISADDDSDCDDDGDNSSGGDVPARSPKHRRH